MGLGLSSSGGSPKGFTVGDALGRRPCSLRSTTAGSARGHLATARVAHVNTNTGGGPLKGGIDEVSGVRYNKTTSMQCAGAPTMSFDRFYPSDGTGDGVSPGKTDLRVAYLTNDRAAWNGFGQSGADTTNLSSPPTQVRPDSLNPPYMLPLSPLREQQQTISVSEPSRLRGTEIPSSFNFYQNCPNPFNPGAAFVYGLPKEGRVTLTVFDLVGKEVAASVNGQQVPGGHRLQIDASNLPSGIYFCRANAGALAQRNRMLLLK